jgi:hypothetical protein
MPMTAGVKPSLMVLRGDLILMMFLVRYHGQILPECSLSPRIRPQEKSAMAVAFIDSLLGSHEGDIGRASGNTREEL